jgi:type I restriction-modification system DNA methylase subunit
MLFQNNFLRKIMNQNNCKNNFKNVFNTCIDILRDNEGIVYDKALKNISFFFILSIIEPVLDKFNLFDESNYYMKELEIYEIETYKKCYKISNLNIFSEYEISKINVILNCLISDIYSKNIHTKHLFEYFKFNDISKNETTIKIIKNINTLDLYKGDVDYTFLGSQYEILINDIMNRSDLGQYPTPDFLRDIMIQYIDPKIFMDGTVESVCDPTMGTGVLLTSYIKYIMNKSKQNKINLNLSKIVENGLIYGKEINDDTYNIAMINLIISSCHIFNLKKGDSICEPIDHMKFDNIMANPPYGVKGIIYEDIRSVIKDKYIPIKSNNIVSLFIQAIIYMLNIGGKCAIVLPDGQDLFSKTNKTLVNVRQYLMRTCDLKEVINIPSSAFENTSIKTSILLFEKKCDYVPVLYKKIYKFDSVCHTNSVKFSSFDMDTKKVNYITDVHIEKIIENMWSLNVNDYLEKNNENSLNTTLNIQYKKLCEICEIRTSKNILKKEQLISGDYEVIGGGKEPSGTHNEYNENENTILISKFGYAGYVSKYKNKIYNIGCYVIIPLDTNTVNNDYLFYYLKHIQDSIYLNVKGINIKNIYISDLNEIQIKIPDIQTQMYIVKYLDFINEGFKTSHDTISSLRQANEYRISNQIQYGKNEVKMLGEICDIDKDLVKHNTYYGMKEGTYKFHTGGENTKLFVEKPDIKELYIIQNRTNGHGKCNIFLDKNFSLAKQTIAYRSRCELTTKYIYYYLFNNITIIEAGFVGANHKNITKEYVSKIQIPLPDLATQQQIVDYCDANQNLIEQLEQNIKINEELSKNFLEQILS